MKCKLFYIELGCAAKYVYFGIWKWAISVVRITVNVLENKYIFNSFEALYLDWYYILFHCGNRGFDNMAVKYH